MSNMIAEAEYNVAYGSDKRELDRWLTWMPLLDVSQRKDRNKFEKYMHDPNTAKQIYDYLSIKRYLKDGHYGLVFGNAHVVFYGSSPAYVLDNVIYQHHLYDGYLDIFNMKEKDIRKLSQLGVILPGSAPGYDNVDKYALHFLSNADDDNNNGPHTPLTMINSQMPSVSFECIRRITANENWTQQDAIQRIAEGQIKVVSYQPDHYYDMTPEETNAYKKWSKSRTNKTPPKGELGYTTVYRNKKYVWHRPATVLLRDFDNDWSFLIGMDDGSYFGCRLVDHPKNIEGAFTSLIPKHLRKRTDLKRQGEWFIVPVSENIVPVPERAVEFGDQYRDYCVYLQRDDPKSNLHMLNANEGYVDFRGRVFARDGSLEHSGDQHPTITFKGWHTFEKNTAIASVSVDGVD